MIEPRRQAVYQSRHPRQPNSTPTVSACLTVWEYIDHVAEGLRNRRAPRRRLHRKTAIMAVAQVYGVTLDQLDDCLVILEAGRILKQRKV